MVISSHVGERAIPLLHAGTFGVEIFFVLSGFLITWLLCNEEGNGGEISLASFYLRRALRILPPALVLIVCTRVLASLGLATVAPWEPVYAGLFARNLMPGGGAHLGHFWSLAIEEQFYVFWPLLFLLLGTFRRRLAFASSLLLFAPCWRWLVVATSGGMQHVNWFRTDLRYTPLMIGCCLGLLRYVGKLERILFKSPITAFLAFLAVFAGLGHLLHPAVSTITSLVGVAILINYAAEHESGVLGSFLNCSPLVWIGKVSYSFYLWQQLFCWQSRMHWLGQAPQNVLASVVMAALSFYFIEAPLGKVRKRIPYFRNPGYLQSIIKRAAYSVIA